MIKTVTLARLAAVAAVLSVTLTLMPAVSTPAQAASGGSSIGGADGQSQDFTNGGVPGGPGGTISCHARRNGTGYNSGVKFYSYIPNCDQDDPGLRLSEVQSCTVALHVWRIYGTVAKPSIGATLSEVNLPYWCQDANTTKAQVWWPNPMDSTSYTPKDDPTRIWYVRSVNDNPEERFQENHNYMRQPLNGANDCWKSPSGGSDIDLRNDSNCSMTTLAPIALAGERCSAIAPPYTDRLAGWLDPNNGQPKLQEAAKGIISRHYNQMVALGIKPVVAGTLADLPDAYLGAAMPANLQPSQVTGLDTATQCSSPVDFVRMPPRDGSAENPDTQRQLGVCVAAVQYVGFRSSSSDTTSGYFEMVGNGGLRTRYAPVPVKLRAGNQFKIDMQKVTLVPENAPLRDTYLKAVKATLVNLSGKGAVDSINPLLGTIPGRMAVPMGWHWPSANALSWQALVPTGNQADLDGNRGANDWSTMGTLDKTITCYTSILTPNIGGVVATPDPANGPNPPPAPAPTSRPQPPGVNGGNDGGLPNDPNNGSSPSIARVQVSMPNTHYVAGYYKTFRTQVSNLRLMCDNGSRVCAHNNQNLDPTFAEAPKGWLYIKTVGTSPGSYLRCTSEKTSTDKCAYRETASAFNASGPLNGQYVDTNYFSGTPVGTQIEAAIHGAVAKVQFYRWEQYTYTEQKNVGYTTVNGVDTWTCPDGWSDGGGAWGSGICRRTVTGWHTVPDHVETHQLQLEAAPGTDWPLKRSVQGSIGGG